VKLVRAFGEAVFELIEQEPARLHEVSGIGPKRARRTAAAAVSSARPWGYSRMVSAQPWFKVDFVGQVTCRLTVRKKMLTRSRSGRF
jgi:hypothetical protein